MLMDPHPSQQHAGLHHAVWQLQQEVTRLKARFKPGVDGGANQVPTFQFFYLVLFLKSSRPSLNQPKKFNLSCEDISFLKKWANPACFLFTVFSNKQYNFYNKSMWKMSIQYTNPQPFEHESSSITTSPGLSLCIRCCLERRSWKVEWVSLIIKVGDDGFV